MQYPPKRSTNYYVKQQGILFPREGLRFYDPRLAPFAIYGLQGYENGQPFRRMPWQVALEVSRDVYSRHSQTSGGRVRFATDSDRVALDVEFPVLEDRPMLTLHANSGFDLYIEEDGKEVFYRGFEPAIDAVDGYSCQVTLPDKRMRNITLYFPLYQDVSNLSIGLQRDAVVASAPGYTGDRPLLFYGSSVTQGASACRPGMTFPALIARRLGMDFINLGFASACLAEDNMLSYLATVKSSVYILDYDHNSPNAQYLRNTHYKAYKTYRDANPDTPIVLTTRPACDPDEPEVIMRRAVVMETYTKALAEGDSRVYFVDGSSFFDIDDRADCTIDRTHPNDLGHYRMAKIIGGVVVRALKNG